MQLPHPTMPSLATPIDPDTGLFVSQIASQADEGVDDEEAAKDEEAKFEHRQGYHLWRRIPTV
eukprot:7167451-Karenia_brevis.AAC.1